MIWTITRFAKLYFYDHFSPQIKIPGCKIKFPYRKPIEMIFFSIREYIHKKIFYQKLQPSESFAVNR
jgi:hypothetical protein